MRTYTLKEVSKKINITPALLRQWEKDYEEVLHITRSKQGARIYSDLELAQFFLIKQMTDKKEKKENIRAWLENKKQPENTVTTSLKEVPLEIISKEDLTPISVQENKQINMELLFEAMETYKKTFLNEIKHEIKSVVHKEVIDEVKKEIKNGTYYTAKTISDSIYKSTAKTQANIEELSEALEKTAELTNDSILHLTQKLSHVSIDTSEEFYSLSRQLSRTTEDLSHYVDVTTNEITNLSETLTRDREYLLEEHNLFRHEVTQREIAFQEMLTSFRDVASAKHKKWWKFWA